MWRLSLFYPATQETKYTLHVSQKAAERARDYVLGLCFPSWPPKATISRTNEVPDAPVAPL